MSEPVQPSPSATTEKPKPTLGDQLKGCLILVVVGLVLLVGCTALIGGDEEDSDSAAPTPPATAPVDAPEAEEPSTEPPPASEPPPPPPPPPPPVEPFTASGSGDDVVEVDAQGCPCVVALTHQGEANFIVSADNQPMGLVNEIGNYTGKRLLAAENGPVVVEIQADGPWTLESSPALGGGATPFDASASGSGDDVLFYTGDGGVAQLEHGGEGNFIVQTTEDAMGVVNEIGTYSGRRPWSDGPMLVDVTADGPWSITVE